MATTLNRTFFGGSTAPGSGVYPEDVKILKVFANYAETDYDPLSSSDTSVYIPTVDKHQYDDGNIVSIIDRVLAAGGSPIVTKYGAEFIYSSGTAIEYKFVNVSGDNVTEMTINRSTGTVTSKNNFLSKPVEVEYGVSTAPAVASIVNTNGLPYVKVGDVIARLYKIEPNKYTFRTTNLRTDDDINYLDIVDYIVNGAVWTTVTKTVSGADSGSTYLKKVSSPASFDTTGLSGMQTVAGVNDVPNDGVYQVSVMLSVTPKSASATKGDLVFGFYGADGIGMADNTFHAVVDDSQTFAQQLSFSTTLNLKAGANSLKLLCDGLNTNYLVFVDNLTVAQLVNGVYHNGNDFDEVHTLTEAPAFNNDDGVLVDGLSGGPRFMTALNLARNLFSLEGFSVKSNAEYAYIVCDSNDVFLFGVKADGSFEWAKGMSRELRTKFESIFESLELLASNKVDKEIGKSLVDSVFASGVSVSSNEEYLLAVLDSDNNLLFGVKRNGNFEWAKGLSNELKNILLEKVDKEGGKSLISSTFAEGVEYDDTEFLYAIKDSDGHVLVTLGKDGSLSWAKGISNELKNILLEKVDKESGKGLVDSVFASGVSVVTNDEYLLAVVDPNDVFLFGVTKDGRFDWSRGIPKQIGLAISNLENTKVDKETGKGLISSSVSACFAVLASEYVGIILDNQNRILAAVDKDGTVLANTKLKPMGGIDWTGDASVPQLAQELKNIGFSSGAGDWSDASELQIPLPKCARVNIKATALPTTKTDDIDAVIEFNDMQGNFFRKNIVINAQGASTLQYPKKNFSVDLLNEDGSEFKLKIGKWVVQDGFHLKAFYTNFLKAEGCVTYDIYDEFQASRGPWHDVPWKTALINRDDVLTGFGLSWNAESDLELRIDTGAVNHPLGFPCLLYFNGEFYGIYVFQLKKNRKNYHMTKSNHKEVHLDGYIDENNLLGGTIDWTKFEVRNPSGLKNMDGTKYDGDNPQEIKACEAKTYIENLSQVGPNLVTAMDTYGINSQEVKELFETHFDVDNVIDYIIFIEAIFDMDSMNNNWQWTTYDGVKWFLNPYDTDACFGQQVGRIHNHLTAHFRSNVKMLPVYYIYHRTDYNERLEARYKYLRDSGVYSIPNFMNKVNTFVQNVGFDAYKAEYQKWVGSFGDSNMDVNSTYWEVVTDANGKPVEGSQETWNSSVQYEVGDVVEHRISSYFSYNGIYTFRCVLSNRNKLPVLVWKIRDSYWRMIKWMEDQLALNDSMYHYT